jgi:hypothetical protein
MEMKKIEAIISSSRLSALCAEMRGAGILAPLLFSPIRLEEGFEQSLAVKSSQKLSGRQRAIVL